MSSAPSTTGSFPTGAGFADLLAQTGPAEHPTGGPAPTVNAPEPGAAAEFAAATAALATWSFAPAAPAPDESPTTEMLSENSETPMTAPSSTAPAFSPLTSTVVAQASVNATSVAGATSTARTTTTERPVVNADASTAATKSAGQGTSASADTRVTPEAEKSIERKTKLGANAPASPAVPQPAESNRALVTPSEVTQFTAAGVAAHGNPERTVNERTVGENTVNQRTVAQRAVGERTVDERVINAAKPTNPGVHSTDAIYVAPVAGEKTPTEGAALMSNSTPTATSASPFARELPARNLAEWPMTARPVAITSNDEVRASLPAGTAGAPFDADQAMTHSASASRIAAPVAAEVTAPAKATHADLPLVASQSPAVATSDGRAPIPATTTLTSAAGTSALANVADAAPHAPTSAAAQPVSTHLSSAIAQRQTETQSGGANFAASSSALAQAPVVPEKRSAKSFVAAEAVHVTKQAPSLGTAVANSLDAMPAASTLPHAPADAQQFVASAVASAGEVHAEASFETHFAPEALSTAHRAVEAVLTAVHRFTSREQHAVNLQFTVGGADLSVRVEMRADEVRATFTTDSAELRAALAHEWNAAPATSASDRPVRLATPVFASNDGSHSGGAADQHASRHGNPGTADAHESFSLAGLRSRAARAAAFEASVPTIAPTISRAPVSTALHLHTLA